MSQRNKGYVARLTSYRCPVHLNFKPLVLSKVDGDGAVRYASGKCCPKMYHSETGTWRLDEGEAEEMIQHLQRLIEEAQ